MSKKFIQLFANCIFVGGANRGLICDLQRNLFKFVPNSLIMLFGEENRLNIEAVQDKIGPDQFGVFREYIDMLFEMEFVFEVSEKESKKFPLLSMEWDYPSIISNIIIELNSDTQIDFDNLLINSLREINCRFVEFRCYSSLKLDYWNKIISIINNTEISSVDILTKYSSEFNLEDWVNWVKANRKVRRLILHSANKNDVLKERELGAGIIILIKENILSSSHCGNIHQSEFAVNIKAFTESLGYNTCLNRKISIDIKGEIKNCPSMMESYGNIKDTRLIDVAINKEFQRVWHIKKDEIAKCKDCEFRRICTDCRAYLENPHDQFSAPLKCGYSPYSNQWENWSTNPLKEKVVQFYGMQELVRQ